MISTKASSLGLEKPNLNLRQQYYKTIKKNQDDNNELNEEIDVLRKTVENTKESFIEKYFMVVWGGIIGGSIVYTASLNDAHLLFKFGVILVLIFLGFIFANLLKKKYDL